MIVIATQAYCKDFQEYKVKLKIALSHLPTQVILRDKNLSLTEFTKLARFTKEECQKKGVVFCINQHHSIARDLEIKNIHLPFESFFKLSPNEKENLFTDFETVGISLHNKNEAHYIEPFPLSYAIVGHILETTSKLNIPAKGFLFLKDMVNTVNIPVYAIGGLRSTHYSEVLSAGAKDYCTMYYFK